MTASYDAAAWSDFAGAVVGASAALAGLLFVSMSINVREILSDARLPRRAAGAVITFTTPLVTSILLLVPGQGHVALGLELVAVAVIVGAVLARLLVRPGDTTADTRAQWLAGTVAPSTLLVGGTLLAGIGVASTSIGGLRWLALAAVAAVVGGLLQAWVLLIEILR